MKVTGIDELIQGLRTFNVEGLRRFHSSMRRGMEYFVGDIVKTQMSVKDGPRGSRRSIAFGLRRDTGTLARAHRTIYGMDAGDYFVKAQFGFPDAPYVVVHQFGTNSAGKNHNITIPKRLYITEEFKRRGQRQIFEDAARDYARRAK